jgi:uracil-DNA glycosylase family 4
LASSDRQAELNRVHERIRQCNDCGLCANITNYVPGEGPADAEIMLVGEAPGAQEDRQGRPFVGPSGSLLTRLLRSIGIDRQDVFITSVVKCRPPGNRAPTAPELGACRRHLDAQIAVIQPRVIITLGRFSAQTLIDKSLSITREHGIPRRIGGILYVPLYHPAAALHRQDLAPVLEEDMRRLRRILEAELALPRRKRAGP